MKFHELTNALKEARTMGVSHIEFNAMGDVTQATFFPPQASRAVAFAAAQQGEPLTPAQKPMTETDLLFWSVDGGNK